MASPFLSFFRGGIILITSKDLPDDLNFTEYNDSCHETQTIYKRYTD